MFISFFEIADYELTTFRAIGLGEEMAKLKPYEDKFDADIDSSVCTNVLHGKPKKILLSEEVFENWMRKEIRHLLERTFTRSP